MGNAEEILRRVVPEYVREGVPFKLAADSDLLRLMGSKNYHRGSSGKFLVAYPQTAEHFIALIDLVHELTRDFEGPYILSDRRYKDNKVVHTDSPNRAQVDFDWQDNDAHPGTSYYYVRLEQADGQLAWASPMWIRYRG